MKPLYKILIISLWLYGCSSNKSENSHFPATYDVLIEYLSSPAEDTNKVNNDTLIVFFDGYLLNDTVDVYINDKFYKEVIIKTDASSSYGKVLKTDEYKKVKNISFRINSGKLIYIEPEKEHYNIRMTILEHKAWIRFYKYFPGFM